jgi:putative spermidine/putrescine transport system substrate-binding protein
MRRELALIAAILAITTPVVVREAAAIEPMGAGEFNVKSKLDLKSLDRADFIALLTPVGQSEGASELVFYDFADTLCDLLAKESQSFTARTGIKVKHVCVDGDTASQQLIAAQTARSKPPADVFFGPNNDMRALTKAGIVANLPLVSVVPEAKDLDQEAALRSRGFEHGGTVLPFHRNQTVIAYDSARIAAPPSGLVEIFDYAKAHDLKVAVTNPTKGGSGSGFIESALLALAPECKTDLYDFSLSEAQAKAVAERCMPKVIAFFKERRGLIQRQ